MKTSEILTAAALLTVVGVLALVIALGWQRCSHNGGTYVLALPWYACVASP